MLAASSMLCACSQSKTLTLGLGPSHPRVVEGPTPVDLPTIGQNDVSNPTLTGDLLEIFFSSNKEIWTARRASVDVPFGVPELLDAVNMGSLQSSPAIAPDGLTLWLASNGTNNAGDLDIWESKRKSRTSSWSSPVNCAALNSSQDDLPRPPGNHGLIMPMSSTRNMPLGREYEIFFASRPNADTEFGPPVEAPELPHPPAKSSSDPFLTADGLTLFYSNVPVNDPGGDGGDIMLAEHIGWGEPFSGAGPIAGINSSRKDSDPWLSPDGLTLYFVSNRFAVLEGGIIADGDASDAPRPDRIYRVLFDVSWTR
jgi:hypothetical protein